MKQTLEKLQPFECKRAKIQVFAPKKHKNHTNEGKGKESSVKKIELDIIVCKISFPDHKDHRIRLT